MLNATAPLSPEIERALIPAAKAGEPDATEAIVSSQVRFLRAEARKYGAASGVDTEDLVSAGLEALLEAIQTYDPARGVRLYTHAQHSIREAMADEVAAYSSSLPVPGRTYRRYRKALRDTETLADARALAHSRDGMDPATFDAVHHALTGARSLITHGDVTSDTPDTYDGSAADGSPVSTSATTLGATPTAPETSAVERSLARQALAALTDSRQREVIALALLAPAPKSDAEIARITGLSRPTVTRTRNAALLLMREALSA